MHKPTISQRTKSYGLAFALPVVSMLIVMLIGGYEPFGDLSMLYSDMYHQYYPFWVEFRDALRSGDSMLYTWSVGLGMDYLSLISYYLASPLNLLGILVPADLTLEFYSLLMPMKLGLASLFFAIFLSRIFQREDYSISFFGAFYGLCGWALAYQWNVMWLDTFALLPLLTLGTIRLLRDKKCVLYTVTLFLSVFANYYIGLFSCIFVLLVFICYEICRWKGVKRFFSDLFRIAWFSILGIGMTAILTIPAFMGLQNTQSGINAFPEGFRLNIASENTLMGLLDAMRQVAGNTMGGTEPSFKEGLPNLYCGVGTVLLAFLFCIGSSAKLREKLCSVCLLLFFMLSFIIRQLDYVWHGFHFTNMIPYRFSFLFSFVLLYMAYRSYLERKQFERWQIISGGLLCLGLILCSNNRTDWIYLCYNIGFLVLYGGIFFAFCPKPRKEEPESEQDAPAPTPYEKPKHNHSAMAAYALVFVVVLELGMNVLNFGLRFPATAVSNYPMGTKNTKAALAYMRDQESGNLFYRTETTHSQTLNDGALNDYNGISTFTSSANVKVTKFMQALGYGAKNTYNRYCYEESSPVSDLFLAIKYRLERNGNVIDNQFYPIAFSSGNVYLLENNAYLPLGFLAEPELADLPFEHQNDFGFQNRLFRAATGLQEDVWTMIPDVSITGEDLTITSQQGYTCSYSDGKDGSGVIYTFTADRNGFACLDFDVSDRNSFSVERNGVTLYSETLSLPQQIAACDVSAGDVITVRLSCKSGESGTMTVEGAILDAGVFRSGQRLLNESVLELTSFRNTLVEGTIHCNRDGLLYTSIPQDGNWKVYVDGHLVEHTLVGDVMTGVMLQKGTHDIRFQYHNEAFSIGWKISGICCLLFVICALTTANRKGKYLK